MSHHRIAIHQLLKDLSVPSPALLLCLFVLGFAARLVPAVLTFLNADEALHYWLAIQPSFAATYRATLTTAHPPFFIIWLHCWSALVKSEIFLRLPSLLAGMAFCWIMFRWLDLVRSRNTAWFGLVLFLFSPSLIFLSAEVRQYSYLLFFAAGSLYLLDRSIQKDSAGLMALSCVALYLALLTHYSSWLFALTLGCYALTRFGRAKTGAAVVATWVFAQAGALAMVTFFLKTHVAKLRASGLPNVIANTYLHRSIFHPGQDHVLPFIFRTNVRFFHYLFSQGVVGIAGLIFFVIGVVMLVRDPTPGQFARPSSRQLASLLGFPLVLNCLIALAGIYPYGGSRHNSVLAIFAMPGIAIALDRVRSRWILTLPATLVVLLLCNLFPHPMGEYVRLRDQHRTLMKQAASRLAALPAESIIFTDDQGGLLLSYYLCDHKVAQIEQQPFQPFLRSRCGSHWVISLDPDLWIFKAETFPETLQNAQTIYHLPAGTSLWFFQAGWFIDKEYALREELREYGCATPQDFGRNMFLCRIELPEHTQPSSAISTR